MERILIFQENSSNFLAYEIEVVSVISTGEVFVACTEVSSNAHVQEWKGVQFSRIEFFDGSLELRCQSFRSPVTVFPPRLSVEASLGALKGENTKRKHQRRLYFASSLPNSSISSRGFESHSIALPAGLSSWR